MNYELAKKLKDAGFPQGDYRCESPECCQPSLSELIEACGGKFGELVAPLKPVTFWSAHNNGKKVISGFGETPEIAVANLWLELNKKSGNL